MALRSCSASQVATRSKAFGVPSRPTCRGSRGRTGRAVQVKALFSPGPDDKNKKFISREEEPDEYWQAKGEKEGANPFKDPIAIVGIIAILFPFIFLLIAIATGAVDTSVYR